MDSQLKHSQDILDKVDRIMQHPELTDYEKIKDVSLVALQEQNAVNLSPCEIMTGMLMYPRVLINAGIEDVDEYDKLYLGILLARKVFMDKEI